MNPARIVLWPSRVLRDGAYPYLFPSDIERMAASSAEGTVSFQEGQTIPLRPLVDEMVATMYAAKGVGLAAPQIGVPLCVAVVDVGDGKLLTLINPKIEAQDGEQRHAEGCLSLPGGAALVTRAERVIVSYFDLDGKEAPPLAAGGLLAIALQHEIDHLAGVTIAERAGLAAREKLKRLMSKTKKHAGPSYLPGST